MSGRVITRDVPFLLADTDGVITEANEPAERLFGATTLVGLRVVALLPERDAAAARGPLRARRLDGTEFPVIAIEIPIRDHRAFHVVDLRDPRAIGEVFASSASLPSRLIAGLHIGVAVQVGGEIVSANPAAATALGLTLDELLGRTSIDSRWRAVHLDGSPFAGEDHPAMVALRTGESSAAVMGIHTPLGELRWIDVESFPFVYDGDRTTATFTQFVDVTAERKANAERAAVLVRYEALLAEASDAVLVVDAAGRIEYVGPSSSETLRRTGNALEGTELVHLAVEEDRDDLEAAFAQCASRPAARVFHTFRVRMADEAPRWFELRMRNAADMSEIGAIIVALSDVDERVAVVERLRRANNELGQRLAEREDEHRVDRALAIATDLLAHCEDDAETRGVIWTTVTTVFRDDPVTFLRARPGTRMLDIVESTATEPRPIDTEECWAMRTHRVHESVPPDGLTCAHRDAEAGPTICIPLEFATHAYGLIVVEGEGPAHQLHAAAVAERLGPLLGRALDWDA